MERKKKQKSERETKRYAIMASELASQGYVVLLPTHNDQSACVAELKNSKIPFKRIPFGTTEGELKRREQLESRTAEVEFVLQKLPHMNKEGPYAGRLDLDKVVLVGQKANDFFSEMRVRARRKEKKRGEKRKSMVLG